MNYWFAMEKHSFDCFDLMFAEFSNQGLWTQANGTECLCLSVLNCECPRTHAPNAKWLIDNYSFVEFGTKLSCHFTIRRYSLGCPTLGVNTWDWHTCLDEINTELSRSNFENQKMNSKFLSKDSMFFHAKCDDQKFSF